MRSYSTSKTLLSKSSNEKDNAQGCSKLAIGDCQKQSASLLDTCSRKRSRNAGDCDATLHCVALECAGVGERVAGRGERELEFRVLYIAGDVRRFHVVHRALPSELRFGALLKNAVQGYRISDDVA